ncbi:MAG: TetR/AcrR family transcriptional regulator [candidate division Zixibacteria bacterium]|nr:TetR/AcrR family transcriptional regulator [candidate division Zixibacteria bacterium]
MKRIETDTGLNTSDDSTRERIVKSAREEFVAHGFTGSRVERIAKQAGVNKAMIYYHFKSKENLYHAVVEETLSHSFERLHRRVSDTANLEDALREIVTTHTELMTGFEGFRPIMLRELANPSSEFLDRLAAIIVNSGLPATIRRRIESGIKVRAIRQVDIRQAVTAFMAMSIGYFLMAPLSERIFQVSDPDKFTEDRKKAVPDIFLNGIRTR